MSTSITSLSISTSFSVCYGSKMCGSPCKPCSVLRVTILSFMQAREVLETMRSEHKKNDCGFFAFTMIRPPLDWLVSLYDDICHRRLRGHKDTCPQQASPASGVGGWSGALFGGG